MNYFMSKVERMVFKELSDKVLKVLLNAQMSVLELFGRLPEFLSERLYKAGQTLISTFQIQVVDP